MDIQTFKDFTSEENNTWTTLFNNLKKSRNEQIIPLFQKGLDSLNIHEDQIPSLSEVNEKLKSISGWQGVPVTGLEEGNSFYPGLAEKKFPIGNFIRDSKDLSYTPEPDIFHDLYGHLPFFIDKNYGDFCHDFGMRASKYKDQPSILRKFERLFWFTAEFGLIKTPEGNRIFGAGIVSSAGECDYSLSDEPEVVPFDIKTISQQEFRIDIMQKKLFLLEDEDQLYSCLDEFEKLVTQLRIA